MRFWHKALILMCFALVGFTGATLLHDASIQHDSVMSEMRVAAEDALVPPAQASEVWVGELVSTGASVNNTTTAVPFTLPSVVGGKPVHLAVSCDTLSHYEVGDSNTLAAVAHDAPIPGGKVLFDIWTRSANIAEIPDSGSSTCEIFKVYNTPTL